MTTPLSSEISKGNNHILVTAFSLASNMCSIDVSYINERIIWLMNLKGLTYREFEKCNISIVQN